MSVFKNIAITVESASPLNDHATPNIVLREIAVLLQRFIESGQSGAIDLRQVPLMGPEAYQFLKDSLSTGEVSATVKSAGRTEVHETACPGVWWVTHRNQKDEIVTEFIEVTDVPDILKSQLEDIDHGLRKLAHRISIAQPEKRGWNDVPDDEVSRDQALTGRG